MITADELFDAYFKALRDDGTDTCKDYCSDPAWTSRASLALVKAGHAAFPGVESATRPSPDRHGQREYLGLDVMLYDHGAPNKPPLFIAEHENRPHWDPVQYATWKLLVVEAQRRMLVAYFGEGYNVTSFDRLKELVQEVCDDNPGKDILLVGGPCDVDTEDVEELIGLQQTAIVGKHHS